MIKLIAALLLLTNTSYANSPLQLEGDYLHCWDGETELAFYSDEDVLDYEATPLELLSKKNILKIRTKGKTYTYSQNVIIMSDGAGNDAVQVLAIDDFGPFEPVVQFTFEHEGAYLNGYYALPNEDLDLTNDHIASYRFQKAISFEGMFCNVGLEDQFGL
ncbi:hypothetical protein A9Q84_14010 [Halobacteriovorax marinus]|uniref:Lipoprotein n=1 Tax=Halobacteriovorax marinus TaxID=97084 RepID=A0A1Y5F926_9BACT|nr:hypothetical protein A9Q84_14010 [Halobacteriovorax marinus]